LRPMMKDNDNLPRGKEELGGQPYLYLSGRKMREEGGLSEAVGFWRKLIAKESRWRDASDAEAKTLR
jgi:hypothetical protein